MSKIDFFALSRPELISETKTFSDPRFGGDKSKDITLTLRALDEVQRGAVQELQEEKVLYYCGSAAHEILPVSDFPPLSDGGPMIELNDVIAYQAASLVVMQAGDDESKYDFEQFVAMALTCPVAWKKVILWRDALNKKGAKQAGN